MCELVKNSQMKFSDKKISTAKIERSHIEDICECV